MRTTPLFDCALLSLLAGLLGCAQMSNGQERKNGADNIAKGFPGYHILTLNERDPELKTFILKHFPKSDPSVVRADFDGDGRLDYALLLKNDKSQATKLVVQLCPTERHCHSVYELDLTGYSQSVYLRPASRGSKVSETEAVDSTNRPSPQKLQSAGVELTYFEQAKIVLYWNKRLKKMEEVQTAD